MQIFLPAIDRARHSRRYQTEIQEISTRGENSSIGLRRPCWIGLKKFRNLRGELKKESTLLNMKQNIIYQNAPLFELGDCYTTYQIPEFLLYDEIADLIRHHVHGLWGGMDPEDAAANHQGVRDGSRIFSTYNVRGRKIYVITEADRSSTLVLFPSEY